MRPSGGKTMLRDYDSLCEALRRLETLPAGADHDRAVAELRAALRALPADVVQKLFAEMQRAALARRVRDRTRTRRAA